MATTRPSSQSSTSRKAAKRQDCSKQNGDKQKPDTKPNRPSTSIHHQDSVESQQLQMFGTQIHHKSKTETSQSHESHRHNSSHQKEASCLEILPPDGDYRRLKISTPSLPNERSSSSTSFHKVKKAPMVNRVNSATRRTPTPTKQIPLEAAKRKQEPNLIFDDLPLTKSSSDVKFKNHSNSESSRVPSERTKAVAWAKEKDQKDGDNDESEEEEDSSSEDELIKAPNELMMEFLDCVLTADYANGLKLCKMILLYEPENAEALNFKSLIEEKIAFDMSNEESEDEDDESDDDEDTDDSTDDDSDKSETSDEDEKTEEEEN